MGSPSNFETATVAEETQRLNDLYQDCPIEMGGLPVPAATTGMTVGALRKTLLKALDGEMDKEADACWDGVAEVLETHEAARLAEKLRDYFRNTENLLHIYNDSNPLDCVGKVLESLDTQFRFAEIALDDVLDVDTSDGKQAADAISEQLAGYKKFGREAHIMVDVPYVPAGQLQRALTKRPLLGKQVGRDANQAVALEVIKRIDDPKGVQRRTSLAAALGQRCALDELHGVAEPMAGVRPDQHGVKGDLGVDIAPLPGRESVGYSEQERRQLARHGVNTAARDAEYGNCIMDANRSLLDGQASVYIFANTVRLRMAVSAMLHRLVSVHAYHDGRRTKGGLEQVMGLMNRFLNRLIETGWLTAGAATVDYSAMKVRVNVHFKPTMPVNEIDITFTEDLDYTDEA